MTLYNKKTQQYMTMHVINYDVIIHTLSCVTENVLVTMKPQVGYFLFTINHRG